MTPELLELVELPDELELLLDELLDDDDEEPDDDELDDVLEDEPLLELEDGGGLDCTVGGVTASAATGPPSPPQPAKASGISSSAYFIDPPRDSVRPCYCSGTFNLLQRIIVKSYGDCIHEKSEPPNLMELK